MNDKQKRKMVAPVIITVVFLLYLFIYLIAIMFATEFKPIALLFAIPLIALATGMIHTLKSRIQEIRSGEEDDLSNY